MAILLITDWKKPECSFVHIRCNVRSVEVGLAAFIDRRQKKHGVVTCLAASLYGPALNVAA